jgi:hypothetical protein
VDSTRRTRAGERLLGVIRAISRLALSRSRKHVPLGTSLCSQPAISDWRRAHSRRRPTGRARPCNQPGASQPGGAGSRAAAYSGHWVRLAV